MEPLQYAVVAYVRNSIARFLEDLRREVYPQHAQLPAHLTILPPRKIQGTEREALDALEALCSQKSPFEITLGEVESFFPTTPTVFIQVAHAAYKMRELHDHLNTGRFRSDEPWPYMPHLTVIKTEEQQHAETALPVIRRRWAQYQGPRRILLDELTFVRQSWGGNWVDLAPVQLGPSFAPAR